MAAISDLGESLIGRTLVALGVLLLYPVVNIIYNLYFHPLSKYPGPKLWAATRLAFIRSLWKGDLTHDIQKIHDKFGPIVRTAPNELSFAKAEAWNDIFNHRPGHLPFPKNPVWWASPPGQPTSILTAGPKDHTRMRRLLNTSFTDKTLRAQEPLIQSYVDMLMLKLRELATSASAKEDGVVLDIVSWYNFTTFDIIGDLGLGQSFDCLQKSALHPWVALIFNHFKVSSMMATVRYYPLVSWLLMKCVPPSMRKLQKDHFQLAVDRIDARMSVETECFDFMTNVLKHNDEKGMSVGEIHATFNILIIAGSETTATVLSGITNYLVRDSDVLQRLVGEVRSSFGKEDEITLAALQRLPYLNATIEEGLRLCPPVPAGLPRLVPPGGDTVCGEWLPEYTNVSVHQWTLSTSPGNFTRPTSFCPDRWLAHAPNEFSLDNKAASQPFSVGPRSCIGKSLAYSEMRLILARMVWNFDMSVAVEEQLPFSWADQKTYILVEKKPLKIRLRVVKRREMNTEIG